MSFNIIPANNIVTIHSGDRLTCSLPRNQIKIEMIPEQLSEDQWKIVLNIFSQKGSTHQKMTQEFECKAGDSNRYFIGYYTSPEEKKRYHVIDLSSQLTTDRIDSASKAELHLNQGLIWFQRTGDLLEIGTTIEGTLRRSKRADRT
ncbi:hypothetical protein [Candidatus Protochlamydia phocaeensis]|uniref:hypothetical protein n=1 Tax=Candidatus Protochlamydia phocaeensis TaxID=1414722 RepID=UPI000838617A|nr:hypothetical protein [Candidatus Protochlamydia phocaeensis]